MGHSGLKTGLNERKFTEEVYIQHHGAVQPHTAIPTLTRALLHPPHLTYGLPPGLEKAASKSRLKSS